MSSMSSMSSSARYIISGGRRLSGEITMHGAKNSVLPILAASLIGGVSVIENCPRLSDVDCSIAILEAFGCVVTVAGSTVTVDATAADFTAVQEKLAGAMRSSILFLGASLARTGRASISFPGGCELGPRPIDLHLSALRKMGAVIEEHSGYLHCYCGSRLKGTEIVLATPSVGATENILLAASTAEGRTKIINPAREPEIVDLVAFLNSLGANITFTADDAIVILGVDRLGNTTHRVIPDRIATATYLCAAVATGGEILVRDVAPSHLQSVFPLFDEMGAKHKIGNDYIELTAPKTPKAVNMVKTMPYPGFPTDLQAPFMAATTVSRGISMFIETIFEARYKHVGELVKMGAKIKTDGRVAVVYGVPSLQGAQVKCPDLRGGAALLIAALAAEGESRIHDIVHVERGYENVVENIRLLGGQMTEE